MLSQLHSLRKAELDRVDDVSSLAIGALKFSDVATVGQGIPGVTKSVKEVEKLWALRGENLSMMPIILRICSACENRCYLIVFDRTVVRHGLR